jgi:hypothetical protein
MNTHVKIDKVNLNRQTGKLNNLKFVDDDGMRKNTRILFSC